MSQAIFVKDLSETQLIDVGVCASLLCCLIKSVLKSSVILLMHLKDLFLQEFLMYLKAFEKLWDCEL